MNNNISFIGGGNMARSFISGLEKHGEYSGKIIVSDPNQETRTALATDFNIATTDDNHEAIKNTSCVVLAVKPQILKTVLLPLSDILQSTQPLIISIVAGIPTRHIEKWCGSKQAIVRCMPNTPALIGAGATAMYANPETQAAQRTFAQHLLESVGITLWLNEETLLDAATAISGSGPAYFFTFFEAMQATAEKLGLTATQAKTLILQTAMGATQMALQDDEGIAILRQRVTSKGGTTAAALASFNSNKLNGIIETGINAAYARSIELAEEID